MQVKYFKSPLNPIRAALLAAVVVASPSVLALNLNDCYQMALMHDPTFQSALKDYEAGLQNNTIGRSALLPKLMASYTQAANRATQWGQAYSGGPNTANTWNYPSNYTYLQLTQPLFSLEAFARYRQGSAQADFSEAKYVFSTQDLLIRVLQAYTDLLMAMDELQFKTAERDAFQEQFKVAKNMNRSGEASRVDMLEAESAYQVANAGVLEYTDLIQTNRRKLETVIGMDLGTANKLNRLPEHFHFLRLPLPSFDEWKTRALESNAELKAAQHNVEIAKQEYRKQHAAHYPVVNLVGAVTTQESNTVVSINQTTNQNYLGVQVTLPIFTGGETYGRSSQAYANYEKSKADYNVVKERILTELRTQYDAVVTGKQKIEALSLAESSGSELVRAMRKSVRVGERIFMDVLIAEKGLFNTRRDLAKTKYTYLVSYLKLNQAAGLLSAEQFEQVAIYFKNRA
jgi:protease secretion system outer membrane protein